MAKDQETKRDMASLWEHENEIPRWSSLAADVLGALERNNASWREIESVCLGLFLQSIGCRFGERQADAMTEAIIQLRQKLDDDELANECSAQFTSQAKPN